MLLPILGARWRQLLLVSGAAQGFIEDIVENMDEGLTDSKELEPWEKLLVQKHFPTPPLKYEYKC